MKKVVRNNITYFYIINNKTNIVVIFFTDMVFCGNEQPLWCCKNAMNNVKHECIFALCNDCKTKRDGKRPKKRTRSTLVNDGATCDHNDLEFFAQSDYFSAEFIKTRKDRGDIFPTKCSGCNRIITNVKTTGFV